VQHAVKGETLRGESVGHLPPPIRALVSCDEAQRLQLA